ncbi:MAG: sulfatase-like hydrolase/transferase [Paludisphaera borealis]|uniref:sulfatase-like hydrolase/transferase n=1 Tax=Paludisphaera borealis TaxID=1387353 RepID=UPI002851257F|nr:sulfatase-like hydrolase/transferase [Paludisphaera borealis]MDR3621499.1 sulfatase-like hydrolase/transferase [Paludisphaera borealis]
MNTSAPSGRSILQRVQARREVREPNPATALLTPRGAVAVSTWFGLVAGLAELGLAFGLKPLFDPSPGLFRMNRFILWTMPTVNLVLFLILGLVAAATLCFKPQTRARWALVPLCMLAVLTLLLSFRKLHDVACLVLACGLGYRLAIRLEPHVGSLLRLVRRSLIPLAAVATGLVGLSLGSEVLRESSAANRLPSPPAAASRPPNVLLIVLDTVRADRMSLYGYERDTTPSLARLAGRGVTFGQARSTAPWTLPSHASMMTGRWRHELSAGMNRPLDDAYPTLAEYLGGHGYDTAGFVANTTYAGAETGLDRGFARYEDHTVSFKDVLWTTVVGRRVLCPLFAPQDRRSDGHPCDHLRKNAGHIRRDLLAWVDREGGDDRPFFAFLNLFDAHNPYLPPHEFNAPFGAEPESEHDLKLFERWFILDKSTLTPRDVQLVSDAYDDCLAYLDSQVDGILGDLALRDKLDDTLVIVTADHGEHFGEHGLYGHASSLYDQELRVPLLVLLPKSAHAGRTVADPVSLRDLPATVVDVLGLGADSPFPGRSLARCWSGADGSPTAPDSVLSSVDAPVETAPNQGRSPVFRGPMKAVASGRRVYIRNGDGREELFDVAADPDQTHDLADLDESKPHLDHLRAELIRLLR